MGLGVKELAGECKWAIRGRMRRRMVKKGFRGKGGCRGMEVEQ